MTVYLQIDLNITDLDLFLTYVQQIPDLINKYGGSYLVQGVQPVVVQGEDAIPERSVLLAFPTRALAETFLEERATSGLHEIWHKSTQSRILLLEGTD